MKGITFSQPMMLAWLAGHKSVTRRLMNLESYDGGPYYETSDGILREIASLSRYRPGETVYIKEKWADLRGMGITCEDGEVCNVAYAADTKTGSDSDKCRIAYGIGWKSPRFMPEWAARSHALIVSVKPEQIRSITPEEIKKEGLIVQDFAPIGVLGLLGETPESYMGMVALMEFESLWESLHTGSWERNDWVWRIELKKKEANHA